jgi:hypothetical protein
VRLGSLAATLPVARAKPRWYPPLSLCALLLACALGTGCGEEADGAVGQIHGTVRNAESGKVIRGARVTFTADTLESAADKTNDEGHYTISVESRSVRGRVEVSKAGYETRVVSVFLDDVEVDIDVNLEED